MGKNEEKAELRYRETMDALSVWLEGQAGKGSPAEAVGIVKALISHASFVIAMSVSGCDVSDAQRLRERILGVVVQFIEEKTP